MLRLKLHDITYHNFAIILHRLRYLKYKLANQIQCKFIVLDKKTPGFLKRLMEFLVMPGCSGLIDVTGQLLHV